MSLIEVRDTIRSQRVSSREWVDRTLERIQRVDPQLHALVSYDGDRAMDQAELIDERIARGEPVGALAGVPILIKDNLCTRFGRTTCSSKMLEGFEAPYDAHVVERLQAEDAVIVGKTNLDEFAMGSSTENSAFGPTRNPWGLDRVPGGSSGGSAAAVAAGLAAGALGSDTGGSIRQPASFCGVTGLKPSYGRVSRYGLVAYGSSLDQIGPITRDVRDAALMLDLIAGKDPRDSTSVDRPVPPHLAGLDQPLGSVRIGYAEEYFGEGLDAEVRRAVEAAIEVYRSAGATIQTIHLPHMKYAIACYYLIVTAEASSNLARYDGVHYGHRTAHPADYVDLYCSSRQEGFGPEVRRRIMLGTYALSSGYYDAYYLKALKVRTLVQRDFEQAFQQVDAIVCPTSPTPPIAIGEKAADPLAMYLLDVYTVSANLAGIPAISIPAGFTASGLPIGVQLMAPHFAEDRLLRIAHEYQLHTDWHARTPAIAIRAATVRERLAAPPPPRDRGQRTSTMSTIVDTVTALQRVNLAYCELLSEKVTLSCGVALFCPAYPTLHDGNHLREVIIPPDGSMRSAFAEVEALYAGRGQPCYRWVPATMQPIEPVEAFLVDQGFTPRRLQVMGCRPGAGRGTAFQAVNHGRDARATPAVRVLPARAMRKALREVRETDTSYDPETRAMMTDVLFDCLDDPRLDWVVAMVDGAPAGCAGLFQVGEVGCIDEIYVAEPFRRQGVALAMMAHLMEFAQRLAMRLVCLEVAPDNHAAHALYTRCGFQADGEYVEFLSPCAQASP